MKSTTTRILALAMFGGYSVAQFAIAPALQAQDHGRDHSYHDSGHNDDHQWNNHEDRAYRMWAKENHRRYKDFGKLREEDRQSYWGWRHDHSDAVLKINIR